MVNRLDEADFHDQRILGDDSVDRAGQIKYYWSSEPFDKQLWNDIVRYATRCRVLEIGCFDGERTVKAAEVAEEVCAIDISTESVRLTAERVLKLGFENVRVCVGNVERLHFDSESFDLVFATGVLHHVDTARAIAEISRVLRPGGVAVFREPLGHNPLINLYRRLTPSVRTVGEHPLVWADVLTMTAAFRVSRITYFGFLSLAAVPLRNWTAGRYLRDFLCRVDHALFNNKVLGRYCWQANFVLYK